MTAPTPPRVSLAQRVDARVRGSLLARLQTVQVLKMSESEMADLIRRVEKDPLFERLLYPSRRDMKILKFQPHPRTRLSPSFYEMNEETLASGAPPEAAAVFEEKKDVLALIQGLGEEKFTRYFLRGDAEEGPEEVAQSLALTMDQIQKIKDFLLSYSVHAEFFAPASLRSAGAGSPKVVRIAQVGMDGSGDPVFEFRSPILARGRYDIHYERLHTLMHTEALSPGERRHLKAFVRRLELINWRQNTLYRILDFVCHTQRHFLSSRNGLRKIPITQRQLAKRLAVAPSTINRAIQGRSLVLPWGEEVLLENLFCSRKSLCVETLEDLEAEDTEFSQRTDIEVQRRLEGRLGFPVPRRTVNSYRRLLSPDSPDAHAA